MDALDWFYELDRKQAEEEKRLPKCDYCYQTIFDDYYYQIEAEIFCEKCMKEHFRKMVDDYAE